MHTASTQSIYTASDFLSVGFSVENYHSSQYASHPVILRGAEGEVAESIIKM